MGLRVNAAILTSRKSEEQQNLDGLLLVGSVTEVPFEAHPTMVQ